jgi:hypothetical protein
VAKKKVKQGYLEGMEPPTIKAIENAAEAYVEARDARMQMGTQEQERKERLAALMKEHKLETYEYDGKVVAFETETTVKVKKKKQPKEDAE